jgi:hypothetical protein
MFDTISARIDHATPMEGDHEPRIVSEARKMIEDLFSSLDQALDRRERRKNGAPDQS